MRQTTLCLLKRPGEILLAMKKRGFGVGRWNGVGGKLQAGESVEAAALREMAEEIGVRSEPDDLEKIGVLKFYFVNKPEWEQEVHIYFVNNWAGEPIESEEMRPAWYGHDQIPFNEMWPDDILWLPKALSGRKLSGEFYFDEAGNTIDHYILDEL
jgi:8-oxo-dGTP pyrophosphatase MutT (NUDIX family)